MQPRSLIPRKLLNCLKNNIYPVRQIWYMGNLVRGKIITTKVFFFLDEASYFRYYIFSDLHCSFVKRIKKIYLTCYVLLRQQVVSTAKMKAINEAITNLKKCASFKCAVRKMN